MDIIEFAEKTSGRKLTTLQKEIFSQYETARREGKQLVMMGGRYAGRTEMRKIISAWENY